jgi:hypothetical protein
MAHRPVPELLATLEKCRLHRGDAEAMMPHLDLKKISTD